MALGMEKWLALDMEQGTYKISLQHLVEPEIKKVLKKQMVGCIRQRGTEMTEIGGNLRKRNKLHVLACNPNDKINIHEYILIYTIECIKKYIRNRAFLLEPFVSVSCMRF